MAERSEASRQNKIKYFDAQPFLTKIKWTINWSLSRQGLIKSVVETYS